MSSGWIVALELFAVLGLVIGLALWDLRSMRRSGSSSAGRDGEKSQDEGSGR